MEQVLEEEVKRKTYDGFELMMLLAEVLGYGGENRKLVVECSGGNPRRWG